MPLFHLAPYLAAAVFAAALLATPGSVAATTAVQLARGEALYVQICRRCHGPTGAEGQVGDIRGLPASVLENATQSGPGMMPRIPLASEDVAAIAAYLEGLLRH